MDTYSARGMQAVLIEKGKKYCDYDFLYKFAKDGGGYIDIANECEKIGKLSKIHEIIDALDRLKTDLYCIVKQEAVSRDKEFVQLQNEYFSALTNQQ